MSASSSYAAAAAKRVDVFEGGGEGPPKVVAVRYRECMKNHAAGMGGHAVDGCGDFMPSMGEHQSPLKCAACGCHRNFHRREESAQAPPPQPTLTGVSGCSSSHRAAAGAPMGYGGGGGGAYAYHMEMMAAPSEGARKRRFRTKFSDEQKQKMMAFAEKVGWRIHKHDENAVENFCAETGITRQVLKVWMHNHRKLHHQQHQHHLSSSSSSLLSDT